LLCPWGYLILLTLEVILRRCMGERGRGKKDIEVKHIAIVRTTTPDPLPRPSG
jgi:hypothetical protein